MALFSQRKGLKPLKKVIQRESIDTELRIGLWNALKLVVWDLYEDRGSGYGGFVSEKTRTVLAVVRIIWMDLFKATLDTMPDFYSHSETAAYDRLREYFFKCKWSECYDFIELVGKSLPDDWGEHFRIFTNQTLETENAAYRFVGDEIVEITDAHEIEAIESALALPSEAPRYHLETSLKLLSDRQQPDYRNSIKESISAVEAICRLAAGSQKSTLGDCLKILAKSRPMHSAFEQALGKLYGFTSDEGGIRHSLTDPGSSPSYADAKFMLVVCSAFVNYLWTRASEENLKISNI